MKKTKSYITSTENNVLKRNYRGHNRFLGNGPDYRRMAENKTFDGAMSKLTGGKNAPASGHWVKTMRMCEDCKDRHYQKICPKCGLEAKE